MGKGCGRRTSELPGRTGEPAGLICTNREHREKRAGRNPGSFIYAFIVERYMETCPIPQRIRQDAQGTGLSCGKKTVLDRMDSGK